MTGVGWRPARAEDLDRLAELATQAIAELAAQRGGQVWARREARAQPVRDDLARALRDRACRLVVGHLDGAVLGYGAARTERLRDGGILGVIEDLYVEPGARGVGIGEELMGALVEWCRAQGCFGVDSLALPGDRQTKNFFEAAGLVARAIVVHRPL